MNASISSEWIFFLGDIYQILMAAFKAWKNDVVVEGEKKRGVSFLLFTFKNLSTFCETVIKHIKRDIYAILGLLVSPQSDKQGI